MVGVTVAGLWLWLDLDPTQEICLDWDFGWNNFHRLGAYLPHSPRARIARIASLLRAYARTRTVWSTSLRVWRSSWGSLGEKLLFIELHRTEIESQTREFSMVRDSVKALHTER